MQEHHPWRSCGGQPHTRHAGISTRRHVCGVVSSVGSGLAGVATPGCGFAGAVTENLSAAGAHHVPASARRGSRRRSRNRRLHGECRRERERRRVVVRRRFGGTVVSRQQRGLDLLLAGWSRRTRRWRHSAGCGRPTASVWRARATGPTIRDCIGIYSIHSSDGGSLTQITSNPDGGDIPGDYSPTGPASCSCDSISMFRPVCSLSTSPTTALGPGSHDN